MTQSIDYGRLEAWRAGRDLLPERPVMFDFDHPGLLPGRRRQAFRSYLEAAIAV